MTVNNLLSYVIGFVIGFAVGLASNKANAFEVPKDAVIKVYTKDGKEIGNMSRKQFKVVPNKQVQEPKVVIKTVYVEREVNTCKNYKNTVTYKLGAGPNGLDTKNNTSSVEVTEDIDPLVGLGYSRKLNEDYNLGVSIHSNKTTTLDFGVNF